MNRRDLLTVLTGILAVALLAVAALVTAEAHVARPALAAARHAGPR